MKKGMNEEIVAQLRDTQAYKVGRSAEVFTITRFVYDIEYRMPKNLEGAVEYM